MAQRRSAFGSIRGWCCCLAAGSLLAGCSASSDDPEDGAVAGDVEIFSWWTSGGEQEALQSVLDLYEQHYPRASVTNASVEYADKAREQLRLRMSQGLPPDTFQANIGADLSGWVLTNGNDDSESKVENLQEVARANGWLDTFDPDVLAAASYDGKLRALPVNVHRINSLVIRRDLFDKYELEVPHSIPELYALCDRIIADDEIQKEAPEDEHMACLGLGNKYWWTLSQMTFEMILPAMAGASYYEQFWTGKKSGDSQEILAALEAALHLYCGGSDTSNCRKTSYFNEDVDEITWDEGVRKIVDKRAMMAAMGDWAKGFLESEGLESGKEFDIVPFPGSDGTFVFTSDTFPLPKGAPNRMGAVALLETFASLDAQLEFNRVKGSIPARVFKDSELENFDDVALATVHDFREAHKVLALSGLLPNDLMPDLATELKASMQFGSTEIIRNYIRANYDAIKQ